MPGLICAAAGACEKVCRVGEPQASSAFQNDGYPSADFTGLWPSDGYLLNQGEILPGLRRAPR